MSNTITPIRRPQTLVQQAFAEGIKKLEAMSCKLPSFSTFPVPQEFTAFRDCLTQATAVFDEIIAAIGHEVQDNSPCCVDIKLFRSPCSDAVDGNALWEIERAMEATIEDHNDMLRSA